MHDPFFGGIVHFSALRHLNGGSDFKLHMYLSVGILSVHISSKFLINKNSKTGGTLDVKPPYLSRFAAFFRVGKI